MKRFPYNKTNGKILKMVELKITHNLSSDQLSEAFQVLPAEVKGILKNRGLNGK